MRVIMPSEPTRLMSHLAIFLYRLLRIREISQYEWSSLSRIAPVESLLAQMVLGHQDFVEKLKGMKIKVSAKDQAS
jgi:hypothetical protein